MLAMVMANAFAQKNDTCAVIHKNSCWYNPGPHVVRGFPCKQTSTCCSACNANPKCVAFTQNFAEKGGTCFLKDGMQITPHPGNCSSGGTILPPAPVPPLPPPPPAGSLNVLLIAIDDLRPELGVYGSHVPTPNLDRFARTAGVTVFDNAYVQYSFCCPSRNSFMVFYNYSIRARRCILDAPNLPSLH